MHLLRNRTALRQLTDVGHEPDPSRWVWAVARLEPCGRLFLPEVTRAALGAGGPIGGEVRGLCHRTALVLQADGAGRSMTIDGRGRVYVPVWLRRGSTSGLLVGTHLATSIVVVAPTAVLDELADRLKGEAR